MSKRRRRNSHRRKSSCSSKQSNSQCSLQIKSPLDNVVQEDNTAEKGETDSFYKENVLLDEEENGTEATGKNRIFIRRCHTDLYNSKKKEPWAMVRGDLDRESEITQSVTIHDFGKSVPKIVIQKTGEAVNLEVSVSTSNSSITLEISEVELSGDTDVKTIFILRNTQGKETDACSESSHRYSFSQYRQECKQHQDHCERQRSEVNNTERKDSESNLSSLSSQDDRECFKSCCKDLSKHCGDEHMDTDLTQVDGSSACSSPFGEIPILKTSLSNDILWDIPVPTEFADQEPGQGLTENIESWHIGEHYVFKQQHGSQYGPSWVFGSMEQLTLDNLKRTSGIAFCNTPLEPDSQEFAFNSKKGFYKSSENHQGDMQGKNNSKMTNCRELLGKRRRTFPDVAFQSDQCLCKDTLRSGTHPSFFKQPVALQDVKAARSYLEDDIHCRLKDGSYKFSRICNVPPVSSSIVNAISIKECNPLASEETSEKGFNLRHDQTGLLDLELHEDIVDCNSTAGPVESSEVTESGFDKEMSKMEDYSEEVHTKDSLNNLLICVTPPSPFSSFENQNNIQTSKAGVATQKNRRCSVVTIIREEYEQRVLQSNSQNIAQKHQSGADTQSSSAVGFSPTKQLGLQKQDVSNDSSWQDSQTPSKSTNLPSSMISNQIKAEDSCQKLVVNQSGSADGLTYNKSEFKEHLRPPGGCITNATEEHSDHWAKKRKLFRESRVYGSAEESSMTSNFTDESDTMNSEDNHSGDMALRDIEDRGFYTETFNSASWIYRGDDVNSNKAAPSLTNHPRPVAVRERTVKISKGVGEYPWGFRIQFSKPIIVTEVDTNGAAEEAGLNIGDYVLAVNGTDVTSVPHSEAVDLARQGPDILTLTIGSDIGRNPNTPRPACRGYLHKRTQSSLLKGWRKRWFVLKHDCCLYYYKNRRDEGKRPALAAVRLESALVGADTSLGKPFVFKCSPVGGNRVYYFCATSNKEMRRWLEAMECAVQPINQHHVWVDVTRHNSNLPPLAVKNPECLGLLNLLDRKKDLWVQRYCILKDGCLYFYNSIRSTYALGGIYLHGYTVREQLSGFKRSIIELKPPSDEFRVFHLCAEKVNENKRWIGAIKTSIGKWLPFHQALQDYINYSPEETKM